MPARGRSARPTTAPATRGGPPSTCCRIARRPPGRRARAPACPRSRPRSPRSWTPGARPHGWTGWCDLFGRLDPLAAMYVVKVLSGDLRIGLRGGLLESAIAEAFGRSLADVQRAVMASGDVGEVAPACARRPARRRAAHAVPAAVPDARLSGDRRGGDRRTAGGTPGTPLWAEDKYDGIRAQLHKAGHRRAALQPRPPRHQRAVPGRRRRGQGDGLGRHPGRRVAGDGRRDDPAVRPAPGPAGPQGARMRMCSPRCRPGTSRST